MVLSMWQVRTPEVGEFDPFEIYANEPTMFTFKVHHGGEFINCPGMKYVRGQIGYVDLVDADEFSVHDFDRMIQQLGYPAQQVIYYYYKIPTADLNIGLKPLGNDMDVLGMFKFVERFKIIDVYTEHGSTKLDTYFKPNLSFSNLQIEEINDEAAGPSRSNSVLLIGWQEQQELDLEIDNDEPAPDIELEHVEASVNLEVENVEAAMELENVENVELQNLEAAMELENVEASVNVELESVEASVNVELESVEAPVIVEVENVEAAVEEEDDNPFDGLDDILGEDNSYKPDAVEEEEVPRSNVGTDVVESVQNMGNEIFLAKFIYDYQDDEGEATHADEGNDGEGNEDESEGEVAEGEGDESDGEGNEDDDSEDSDFLVDEDNMVENVEVDMAEFKANVEYIDENEVLDLDDEFEDNAEIDLDDFNSASDSDNDTPLERSLRKLRKKHRDWKVESGSPFYVGQSMLTKEEITDMVVKHAVDTRRQLVFYKNDKLRVRVICHGDNPSGVCTQEDKDSHVGESSSGPKKSKGKKVVGGCASNVVGDKTINTKAKVKRFPKKTCPWTLHISRRTPESVWCVKTYAAEHICLTTRNVRLYTKSVIAKEIEPLIESNPTIPIKSLQQHLQRLHQLHVSLAKCNRAKTMALQKLHGDYSFQYKGLRDYCEELIRSNPGTTVKIDVEVECNPASTTRQFKRVYICFAALREGFKKCGRDLLGLDGCFLKGPYPGQILTAVGVDSNNGIYPVAYAVVEAETLLSWTWFLQCLADDMDLAPNSNFTFISDRQKGLIPALQKVFPSAEHRYCLRHIHENMKSKWRGNVMKDLLWKCATATTVPSFERRMEAVKTENEDLYKWLREIPAKHWSRSHFSERPNTDLLLNNLCEVFNKQLVGGRDKPIITCLEYIREYLMRKICNVHKLIVKSTGPLTPAATKTFTLIKTLANDYNVILAGVKKFQVNGPWGDQTAVDLENLTCSCRRWQLTGMPCKHAVASIWEYERNRRDGKEVETWVAKCYWLETWKNVYQHTLEPINGVNDRMPSACPTTLIAPKHHTPVGRPKKKRKKSAVELAERVSKDGKLARKGNTVTCSKCKKQGHNAATCKGQGPSVTPNSQGAPTATQGPSQS